MPPTGSFVGLAFSGNVLAGSTPIVGAEVQLYTTGSAGNGSAGTQLLASGLITDANGAFRVAAGSYTCPVGVSVLYIIATGGQVGSGAANSATSLITVPGACQSLSNANFMVNELTTAGTVFALRPFLATGGQLGSSATNASGLNLGVATLGSLVNLSAGTAPGAGFPANGAAPSAKLNTIANLLHGCVAADVSGGGTCGALFNATATTIQPPNNTLDAALNLVNNPGENVPALYGLSTGSSAFSPALATAPPDWTLPVSFTGGGMNQPATVAIDAVGNVWVVNYAGVASLFSNTGVPTYAQGIASYGLQESYGGAVDANGTMWITSQQNSDYSINNGMGSVTLLNTSGPALPGNSLYSAGGLNFPLAIAFDSTNTAWIADYGDSYVTLLSDSGVPLSGDSGYTSSQLAFSSAIAVDSQRNGWVANFSSDNGTVTKVTPDGSSFTSYTVGNGPAGVAIDAADNVWTANYYDDSVGLVSGGRVLSGNGYVGGGLDHPDGIAADGSGTVWVVNHRAPGLSQLAGASTTLPGAILSPVAGWAPDTGMSEGFGVAIDAAGNVWVSSNGDDRLIEYVGLATPVKTPLMGATRIP